MKEKKPITREWVERSKNVLAQNHTGTNSKRWTQYVDDVYPSHSNGIGNGPYLFDFAGNKYLDFISALGSLTLGYSNAKVSEAVERQSRGGASHSLPTTLEVEVAEQLLGLIPSMDKVRFLKTGNEAALAAVRIARAHTGCGAILNRGYHGHGDIFTSLTPPALGIEDAFKICVLEDDFEEELDNQLGPDIAAVIVEALELEISPKWTDYLHRLQAACKKRGILFIIDEIITGFRVPKWTATNMMSLDPDMILLGKGIANGWPLSVVMGKKEVMDSTEYFISSTFSGEATSLAACKATIAEIQHKRNFEDLLFYGQRLQDRLNALHPEIQFKGYGTRAMLNVTNPTTALFMQEMCRAGFLFGKAHFFHFGHLEANTEEITMTAAESVVRRIKNNEVKLEGIAPEETFKR